MDLSKYNSGDFGFFVRPCISTLWGGEIRWRLEDQKSWMGNISCLRSGNELDIHQPSSNRIFPLLSVCSARIEMKMRMSEEGGGWKFCLIPCHENICRAVLVVRRGKKANLTLYQINVVFDIIVFDKLYQRWIWHYFYFKKIISFPKQRWIPRPVENFCKVCVSFRSEKFGPNIF